MRAANRPPPLPPPGRAGQPRRRRWSRWGGVALLLVIGVTVVWRFTGRREPDSLDSLIPMLARPPRSAGFEEAKDAVLKRGTNALPAIRDNLNARNNFLQEWYRLHATNLAYSIRRRLTPMLNPYLNQNRRVGAARAIGLLGTNAASLLPELLSAFEQRNPNTSHVQSEALIALGELSVPPMLKLLHTGSPQTKSQAVYILHQLGSRAAVALPDLVNELRHAHDPGYELQVIQAIHRVGGYASGNATLVETVFTASGALTLSNTVPLSIPALLTLLDDDPEVQLRALQALGASGQPSLVLALRLLPALESSSEEVRTRASLAIALTWPMHNQRLQEALAKGKPGATALRAGVAALEQKKEVINPLLAAWLGGLTNSSHQDRQTFSHINWRAYSSPAIRKALTALASDHPDQAMRAIAGRTLDEPRRSERAETFKPGTQ